MGPNMMARCPMMGSCGHCVFLGHGMAMQSHAILCGQAGDGPQLRASRGSAQGATERCKRVSGQASPRPVSPPQGPRAMDGCAHAILPRMCAGRGPNQSLVVL